MSRMTALVPVCHCKPRLCRLMINTRMMQSEIVSTRVASSDDSDDEPAHRRASGGGSRRAHGGGGGMGGPGALFGHMMGGLFHR